MECSFVWHIWHVLLYGSQHRHVVMLVVHILVVLHKVCAGGSTELHLTADFIVAAWWPAHSSAYNILAMLAVTPIFVV